MYGTLTTPKKKKLYTKGKHVPTACNAQNFNSIKSSWPKGTPNAIQEQRRSGSLILALPESNITEYFTLRATHTQTDKKTQVETHAKPCEGRFGFSSCEPDWPTGHPANDLSPKHLAIISVISFTTLECTSKVRHENDYAINKKERQTKFNMTKNKKIFKTK